MLERMSTTAHASPGPMHAAGAHSVNLQLPIPPVPVEDALQKAIQEYVNKLSNDDKAAFRSAPNIIEHLEERQANGKYLISSSLVDRVEKVLQCVKTFMSSLGIVMQQSQISGLILGGVNCILTVGISYTCYSY